MIWILLSFLLLSSHYVSCDGIKHIDLTTKNNLILRGPVDEKSVSRIIYELNLMSDKNNVYLYIDTPGGELESGQRLIGEVINHNISCVAERAYSMGFAILQSCKNRYILRHGRLMMHQVSFGIKDDLNRVINYVNFVEQMDFDMTQMMSDRIKMTPCEFRERVKDEWWLYGLFAVAVNAADDIVTLSCSTALTVSNYTHTIMGDDVTYSRCPLVTREIGRKKGKGGSGGSLLDFLSSSTSSRIDSERIPMMI